MDPLLRLTSITKSFGGVQALKGVSFELQPGEVHALVGENGAGKSTLVKVITGAHPPDSGSLQIRGQTLSDNDPGIARSCGVAAIYQQPALFPDLTVAENIGLRLETGGTWRAINWGERRRRAKLLLDQVAAEVSPEALVRDLTMPQQQLVEIASALGGKARILILDEPTSSLSDREVAHLFRVIRELKAKNVGMIYISHRLEELPQIADRVTVLRDGNGVGTRPMSAIDSKELIRLMVGRDLTAVFPKVSAPSGDVILETRALGCGQSVHDVHLTIRAGEVVGVSGLIGAGRTELARILFGLTPSDSGQIFSRGRPVTVDSPEAAVALGIAHVPEDRRRHGVVLEMPVSANTTLAILRKISRAGMIDFAQEQRIATSFVDRLDIKTPSVNTSVEDLSGGNQQKVALARWLATEPSLIILDEPTQGVDIGAKAEIHRLIGQMTSCGMAVLMISSELPEVLGMSDRIAVMHAGTIAGMLDRAEATQEKLLALALGHTPQERGNDVVVENLSTTATRHPERTREGSGPRLQSWILRENAQDDPSRTTGTSPSAQSFTGETGTWIGGLARHRRELSVAAAYFALLLVLAIAAPDYYLRGQLRDTWISAAPVLVAAVGMTLVILARHIDISIGAQFSIGAVAAGMLAKSGLPMPAVVVCTLALGAIMGALNGGLVAGLGLPSIVATLATMAIFRESLRWYQQGAWIIGLPAGFQWCGAPQAAGQGIVLLVALAVLGLFAWAMRWLAAGRAVYAVGSDQDAARLAGVRPRRVVFGVFVLMGILTALAALLRAVRFAQVDPNSGNGLELQTIAAVVVGGTAISGGRGTLFGSLLGVALLGTIGSALGLLGGQAQWDKAIQGAVILLAVASDGLSRRAN
ncbi:MAG: ATP-binding cassette domain-containing protein [Tepidisphaeraceae bacterium]